MRPFAQQLRGLASRPIPATASTLLAYIFETILRLDPARSVAALPPPLSFLRPRRVRSTHGTRCLAQSKDSWFVCELFGSPPGSLDPSGSKPQPYREPRSLPCRLPDLPSLPAALQKFWWSLALRIIVPDPLLPARLTVLRTSWNHSHHAPDEDRRQCQNATFLKK